MHDPEGAAGGAGRRGGGRQGLGGGPEDLDGGADGQGANLDQIGGAHPLQATEHQGEAPAQRLQRQGARQGRVRDQAQQTRLILKAGLRQAIRIGPSRDLEDDRLGHAAAPALARVHPPQTAGAQQARGPEIVTHLHSGTSVCPSRLRPQQMTVPAVLSPQVCSSPSAMDANGICTASLTWP